VAVCAGLSAVCFAVLAGIEVHKTFSRLASDKKAASYDGPG
jgi:uncharacterized protein YsxB (DUF464 family)